jgi:predicted nucleic acid-binding Zn ribbon protein
MATYLYETIPQPGAGAPRRYEVVQSMKDSPLTRHPDTGEAVRRVISGGYGIMSKPQASGFKPSASPAPAGCSPGCACHSAPRVPAS